jgi:hypothetical protein
MQMVNPPQVCYQPRSSVPYVVSFALYTQNHQAGVSSFNLLNGFFPPERRPPYPAVRFTSLDRDDGID